FDLAYGESASRRRGEPFSTEIIIELTGRKHDGTSGSSYHEIVHPDGQAPLSALGVALGVESLLGLGGGTPAAAGLHLPELLIEPAYYVRRMEEFGARFETR
ncbi:NAD(P)-dependent oxidoreductase, partial [Rhizobiaceae sp. 2RAB30]